MAFINRAKLLKGNPSNEAMPPSDSDIYLETGDIGPPAIDADAKTDQIISTKKAKTVQKTDNPFEDQPEPEGKGRLAAKIEQARIEAKRLKAQSSALHMLSNLLIFAGIALLTIYASIAFRAVAYAGRHEPFGSAVVAPLILITTGLLFVATLAFWAAGFFWGGWLYDPENPDAARRGLPRDWFRAMNRTLQENEPSTAGGLTWAINLTVQSRSLSIHFRQWSMLLIAFAIVSIAGFWFNVGFAGFASHVNAVVGGSVEAIRNTLIYVAYTAAVPHEPLVPPIWISAPLVLLLQGATLLLSIHLWRTAEGMYWNFLTIPDVVRRFMYYFRHKQNKGSANFNDEKALTESIVWVLDSALQAAPASFFTSKGRLFFFEEGISERVESIVEKDREQSS